MRNINLISSYARALFHVSGSGLNLIRQEVQSLLAFLEAHSDVLAFISCPVVSLLKKREVILSINANLSENLIKFIMVVIVNKRSSLLISILKKFIDFVMESENELEITIKSVEILNKLDIKIITESLGFLGKIKKVTNVVDPSILGGFVVRYGFNLIDASLKSYLDRLVNLSKMEILRKGILYEE